MKKNNFRELINHYKDCIMLGFAERISKKVFQGNGFPWLNSNGKGCIQAFSLIQWLYDGTNHKRLDILVVIHLEWRIIKILRRCCNSILHFKMIYCLFEVCIPNELLYVFIYMYTKLSYLAKKILFHVVIENNRKFLPRKLLSSWMFLGVVHSLKTFIFYGLIWIRGELITYPKYLTLFIAKEHLFLFLYNFLFRI